MIPPLPAWKTRCHIYSENSSWPSLLPRARRRHPCPSTAGSRSKFRRTSRIGGSGSPLPDYGVEREAIETVGLRRTSDQRSDAFGEVVAVCHRRMTGGVAGGRGRAGAGVAPGVAVAASAGSINTPVALSMTVTVLTRRSSKMMSMILPRT